MHDAVTDWRELSALYERADLLSGAELQGWLATLRDPPHPLLGSLLQMLEARAEVQGNGFLDALPTLPLEPEARVDVWQAGARIGPYRLQRPLGAGGMAEVWLAQRVDGAFQRTVAIKLLFRHTHGRERDSFAQRFARERDILASLHHPNIAGLHDAGVTPFGQPWLALEHVEGEPLIAWCDAARLGLRARVELFIQVLLAVQHAHANLVIHRDLKPANILVTKFGEARLLDFGIAKLMEAEGDAIADTELTRHAGRLMTVRYASPEQLTGQPLTTACDVYSLGVVLYELLCGELPYEMKVDSAAQLEQAILEVEPRAPSRRALKAEAAMARGSTVAALRKLLGNDLDAIVLRALAKQPAQRYPSVEALRAELARWLLGEPVEARTPSNAYRLRKFAGRHVIGVALGSAALTALLVVATTAVWLGMQARQESARATAARDFMMGMFKQADSDKSHGADMTARQLLDRGRDDVLKRLKGQPELQADLLEGIVGIQMSMRDDTKADVTYDKLTTVYSRLGDSHKLVLTLAKRAENALRTGDIKLASSLVEQAISKPGGYISNPDVAISLDITRGWIAIWEGKPHDAKSLFRLALALAEAEFGNNSQRALDSLIGVVQSETNLREYGEALAAHRDMANRQMKVVNKTARDIVDLDLSYADLLYVAGQFSEVANFTQSAVPRCVVALGAESADCRRLSYVGTKAHLLLGSENALRSDYPLLTAIANDSSSPHFQLVSLLAMFRVRSQLDDLSQYPDLSAKVRSFAAPEMTQSISPERQLLVLQELAADSIRRGRFDEAGQWLNDATVLQRAGDNKEFGYAPVAKTQMLLGILLMAQNRPDEALTLMQSSQAEEAQVLGLAHPLVMLHMLNQANALSALGRFNEAVAVVKQAEPILKVALGTDCSTYQKVADLQKRLIYMKKSPHDLATKISALSSPSPQIKSRPVELFN